MNKLYDLYKKVYSLNRKEKIHFNNNFFNIIVQAKKKDFVKTAMGPHDPETIKDLKSLVDKLEKYINIDGDISYDSISIFTQPMSSGSRKLTLRPCKLVGLVRKLNTLAREYKREYNSDAHPKILKEIRKDFFNTLRIIKNRIEKNGDFKLDKKAQLEESNILVERLTTVLETNPDLTFEDALDLVGGNNFDFDESEIENIKEIVMQGI